MTFEQAVTKVQDIMSIAKSEKIGKVAIQINFTNDDCKGAMYISSCDGKLDVAGYDYTDNDASIDLMYGDFTKILTGRLSVNKAIENNLINIVGSIDAVMAIAGCAKKPAVKKAKEIKSAETKPVTAMPATKTATAKPAAKPVTAKPDTKTATATPATKTVTATPDAKTVTAKPTTKTARAKKK